MPPFQILLATPLHAALIAELQAACFPDPWTELDISEILSTPACIGLICQTEQQQPVGFSLNYVHPGESEILSIGVPPLFRQKGIGQQMLSHLYRICRQKNSQRLFLEVAADNRAALALYHQQGFEQIGERPNYYKNSDGTRQDALILRKMIL